jgi:hypothetical protein
VQEHRNSEYVCGACFDDEGLQEFCVNHAESNECDFCSAMIRFVLKRSPYSQSANQLTKFTRLQPVIAS